jgi:intracellular sulfur oxidation DsrE/DsrF family protein
MKNALFLVAAFALSIDSFSQSRVNPVIHDFGGVFEIVNPDERPDPTQIYNVVIEVERESDRPDTLNWALNNVARLLNLHAVGGVPAKNMNIVLAIHGGATYTTMDNETYRKWYKKDNPNLKLFQQLKEAGVKIFVCGQSLIARRVDRNHLVPEVKTSVSMLTVMTTYQMRGYVTLKF